MKQLDQAIMYPINLKNRFQSGTPAPPDLLELARISLADRLKSVTHKQLELRTEEEKIKGYTLTNIEWYYNTDPTSEPGEMLNACRLQLQH